jgi:hypothetical protein
LLYLQRKRGDEPEAVTRPSIPETKNRYAICVGINQYAASAQVSDLRYAEQDAQALYTLLLQHGFEEENCRLLLGSEATLGAIYQALEGFVLTKPDRDDLVLFFFAGHGVPLCIDEGRKGKDARCEVFLTSYDFDRYKVMDNRGAWLDYRLRMGWLREGIFEETLSEKVLFLFDCCYSGDFHRSAYQDRDGEKIASQYITAPFAQSSAGHIVLSSCLSHQTSREEEKLQHGVFTYHLLEALEGRIPEAIRPNGWITVGSLFDSLSEKLPDDQRPVKSGVELDTFKLLCYPDHTANAPVASTPFPNHIESEKESHLKAMMADHSAFMHDRLSSFVGRQQELEELRQRIDTIQQTGGYVTITGQAGQGKSSIIAKLVEEYGPEQVAHHFIPFNPGPDHQVGLLRNLMARLICKYHLSEIYVASESRPALRDYFPKVLAELSGKGGQEVIFVDGLDQLETDLSGSRDLSFLPTNPPKGVVFVLGTRPDDTLKPLTLLKPHCEYRLSNLSRQDFDLILHHRQVKLDKSLADQFYQVMQENALYLDLLARELADDGVTSPVEIIRRVADNPNGIFSLAMTRLKRDRPLWREVIKPVLGVLLTACEPLSIRHIRYVLGVEDDLLREGIERLGGLIAKDGQQRCSLFHLKLQDYLRQDENKSDKEYIFATDEEEGWHKKLAQWCEQSDLSAIWQDVKGNPVEEGRRKYARRHYVTHLYYAEEWQQLFAVLDSDIYGKAKIRYDPSMRSFAQDLNFGQYAAARGGEEQLSRLWRYTLLKCSLTSRADKYPLEAFDALILLKRGSEAIGLAELLTEPNYKAKVMLRIAKHYAMQENREQEYFQMLLRSYEVVCTIKVSQRHSSLLNEMGMELIKAQLWDLAEELALTTRESETHFNVLRKLVEALAKAQQWERAEKLILTIRESGVRARALEHLGKELVKAHLWERAEKIIQNIDVIDAYISVASELSMELIKVQQWERAEKLVLTIRESEARFRVLRELVKALAKARRWERAEEVACTIEGSEARFRVLQELVKALAKAQQWERAEEVARTIENHVEGTKVIGELSVELARAHQWKLAEKVAGTIATPRERSKTLVELGMELIESQQWEYAERLAGTIGEYDERNKILSELYIELLKDKKVKWAKKILISIRRDISAIEIWKRDRIVSELSIGLAKAQQWEQAKKIAGRIENSEEYAKVLYVIVAELARAWQWEQAKKLWVKVEKMRYDEELGVYRYEDVFDVRNSALYELVKALIKAQQQKQAEKLWAEVEERIWEADYFEAFVEVLSTSVIELVKAQRWERARELMSEAEENIYNAWNAHEYPEILIEVGKVLVKELEWEQAEEDIGYFENLIQQAKSFIERGSTLVKERQWEEAQEELTLIVDAWERVRFLSELSLELAQARQWERAEEVANTIEESGARTEVLSELSIELARAQQWERAEEVANTIEESGARAKVLYVLVGELAKAQRWEKAEKVWTHAREMKWADKETIQALCELGAALTKVQQWEQVEYVWNMIEEAIYGLQQEEECVQSLVDLSTQLFKAQKWKKAEYTLNKLRKSLHIINMEEIQINEFPVEIEEEEVVAYKVYSAMCRDRALLGLSIELARVRQWKRAEEVAYVVKDHGMRVEALIELGKQFACVQQNKRAREMWAEAEGEAQTIKDDWVRVNLLKELGIVLVQERQWKQAEEMACTIEDFGARAEVLIELGKQFACARQDKRAREMWAKAEGEAQTIKDDWVRVNLLKELGIVLAQERQWKQAEEMACTIEDFGARTEVLIELGKQFACARQDKRARKMWIEAEKVIHSLKLREAKAEMLQKLAIVLNHIQSRQEAVRLLDEAERVIYSIQEGLEKERLLALLSESLAQLKLWEKAEETAVKVKDGWHRSRLLLGIGKQLVEDQQQERAKKVFLAVETLARAIVNVEDKSMLLKEIAQVFSDMREHEQLVYLIQHSWLQANTREDAIKLLPMVSELIPLSPSMGRACAEAFTWVDDFLQG